MARTGAVRAEQQGTPIPVFPVLLARHDLTRFDVLLYGAVVYVHGLGRRATTPELAGLLRSSRAFVRLRIGHLCDVRLLRQTRPAKGRALRRGERFLEVLGPRS